MMKSMQVIIFMLLYFPFISVYSDSFIQTSPALQETDIAKYAEISEQEFSDCRKAVESSEGLWQKNIKESIVYPGEKKSLWLRWNLENQDAQSIEKYILFFWNNPEKIRICQNQEESWSLVQAEMQLKDQHWIHELILPVIKISFSPNEKKSVYIRIESHQSVKIPVSLVEQEELIAQIKLTSNLLWLFGGFVLIIILYNIFQIFYAGDSVNYYYILYILSMAASVFLSFGQGNRIFAVLKDFQNIEFLFLGLSGFGAAQFSRKFLFTQENIPYLDRLLQLISFVLLAFSAIWIFPVPSDIFVWGFSAASGAGVLLILAAGLISVKNDSSSAEWFLYGWMVFTVLGILNILYHLHYLPYNIIIVYSFVFYVPLDFSILNIAMFKRVKSIELENILNQEKADILETELIKIKSRTKYEKSHIRGLNREKIAGQLKNLMETEKIFLDEDLRSGDLAAMLRLTPHQFSEFLSEVMETSFHRLIQEYRIKEAMILLRQDKNRNVLNIGMDVGFQSKSAFNSAFKKITGMTPMQYKNQTADSSAS